MNKEIKFRIYNKATKLWVHGPGEEVNLFGETILLGGFMKGVSIKNLNNCVAQQYTNLKDKDSREIYEGDVLRIQTEDDPEDLQWELAAVEFKNGCFWISGVFNQPLYELIVNNLIDGEIVGNIFENGELLDDR
jgi:uncharacterized phage protein (TIGR01671 family)